MTTIRIYDGMDVPRRGAYSGPNVYVCICNGVTDQQIREAAAGGCDSVAELTMRTGCGANCGSCLDMAAGLLEQARATRELPLPLFAAA